MPLSNHLSRTRRSLQSPRRSRVARAFRLVARGVDQATAFARSKAFYRSGGGAWARSLA
jgi:hypothetical protein